MAAGGESRVAGSHLGQCPSARNFFSIHSARSALGIAHQDNQREYATMALAGERPILLIKKLGGVLLLLFGLLLTALGFSSESTGLITIGILALAAGAILLALKIIRRNQNSPL
jgi:hypothetical protein